MKGKADALFYGGKIYTMEAPDVCKEAVVLKDGKFAYVGTKEEALAQFDCEKCIDLQGKTVLPGMGDSHLHFFAFCQAYTTVDLGGATSRAEALQLLRERAAETPKGEWIKGSNFDQSKWKDCEDQLPTRLDLDEASTDHPIVIKRVCLHTAVANTMALEKANITNGYVFGPGGMVELDADGNPNGIFREQASKIYDSLIPDPFLVPATREKCMRKGLALASSLGVTMMHTYAAAIWHYDEDFADYVARSSRGELPVRMFVCLDYMFDPEHLTAEQRSDPYRAARMGSFKSFSDGSLGSRSAKLYTDYADDPGNTGILVISPEDLAKRMYEAYRHGLQPATHCIGDEALEVTLDAVEYCLQQGLRDGMTPKEQAKRLPFRLIHAQMATPELIERMKKLPLVLDIQPTFLMTDLHWIEGRVGKERAALSYPWKTYLEEGLVMAGGSDAPVESFNPWLGIYAAVTRQDMDGYPVGGYHPDEKISVYDAVCMYSKNVAYANGNQDLMGTIEAGKFADMVVIDRDIFHIPENDIKDIQVLNTYMAGIERYHRD